KIDPDWEHSDAARRAIPALKSTLISKEYWVRQSAADTMARLSGLPKTEPSLTAFTDPVYYKRTAALQALVHALGDWDRDLRLAAAEALGRLSDPRAKEPLAGALNDSDPFVRASAAQALRKMGGSVAAASI
ncbi:MAG TPA: HEAT repeat domain-containing protein, partial [Candidatus Saccharimonadales bacterium]|nr:HEAT repeat domain-containing protein [Candidatus Saccharimonadales bacterium]